MCTVAAGVTKCCTVYFLHNLKRFARYSGSDEILQAAAKRTAEISEVFVEPRHVVQMPAGTVIKNHARARYYLTFIMYVSLFVDRFASDLRSWRARARYERALSV